MLRVPYMAGENDIDQLDKIFLALGTPTEEEWPVSLFEKVPNHDLIIYSQNHSKLPGYLKFEPRPKPQLGFLFRAASSEAVDWLTKTLAFNPLKRITARQVGCSSEKLAT